VTPKRFYGEPIPNVDSDVLRGRLIVLEGADGSGRSTQVRLLNDWLEGQGYATVTVGLRRSNLVSKQLDQAKEGNILGCTTLSLFYATDFADQLENVIIPGLRAGFVVLADRYIYTLMARDIVRGADPEWCRSVYSIAIVPDAVFYLRTSPRALVERNFQKRNSLDYWESGMDIGLSRDMFTSFIKYQRLIQAEFRKMMKDYGFTEINGNRSIRRIAAELQGRVGELIGVGAE
jgi:dTMP kinase